MGWSCEGCQGGAGVFPLAGNPERVLFIEPRVTPWENYACRHVLRWIEPDIFRA